MIAYLPRNISKRPIFFILIIIITILYSLPFQDIGLAPHSPVLMSRTFNTMKLWNSSRKNGRHNISTNIGLTQNGRRDIPTNFIYTRGTNKQLLLHNKMAAAIFLPILYIQDGRTNTYTRCPASKTKTKARTSNDTSLSTALGAIPI